MHLTLEFISILILFRYQSITGVRRIQILQKIFHKMSLNNLQIVLNRADLQLAWGFRFSGGVDFKTPLEIIKVTV